MYALQHIIDFGNDVLYKLTFYITIHNIVNRIKPL